MEIRKKYSYILAIPSFDGIFAAGLLNRIFNTKVKFGLRIPNTEKIIIVGMPINSKSVVRQSFIIDISKCEKMWEGIQATNMFLCDDRYGSLTDFIVEALNMDVPQELLDLVFKTAVWELDPIVESIIAISSIMSSNVRQQLVNIVYSGLWEKLYRLLSEIQSSGLFYRIRDHVDLLEKNATEIRRGVIHITQENLSGIRYSVAKLAAIRLVNYNMVVIVTECQGPYVIRAMLFSKKYDLTGLGINLIRLGYPTLIRPNLIRMRLLEPKQEFIGKILLMLKQIYRM